MPGLAPRARVLEDELREEAVDVGPIRSTSRSVTSRLAANSANTGSRCSLKILETSSSGSPARPRRFASGNNNPGDVAARRSPAARDLDDALEHAIAHISAVRSRAAR